MRFLHTLLHDPALHTGWRWLSWLLMLVACGFAFTPRPPQLQLDHSDKLQHLLAFVCVSGSALLATSGDGRALGRVLGHMLAFGVFIEVVQAFLPTRTADWRDVVADMAGAALGVLLVWLARRLLPARLLRA